MCRRKPKISSSIVKLLSPGYQVQGYTAEEVAEDNKSYEAILCALYQRMHLVNPATSEVAGESGDD